MMDSAGPHRLLRIHVWLARRIVDPNAAIDADYQTPDEARAKSDRKRCFLFKKRGFRAEIWRKVTLFDGILRSDALVSN